MLKAFPTIARTCAFGRLIPTDPKVEWSCQVLRTHHVCSMPPLTSGKVTNVKQHLRVATFFSGLRYSSNPKSMDGYLVQDTLSRDLARYHRHISRGMHEVAPQASGSALVPRMGVQGRSEAQQLSSKYLHNNSSLLTFLVALDLARGFCRPREHRDGSCRCFRTDVNRDAQWMGA